MAKNYLPDADHMARHIGSQLVERDPNDGTIKGCFPQAFELRANERYLSAYWVEFFGGSRVERFKKLVDSVAKVRTVRPNHAFAIGNVGAVREACASFNVKIRVVHEPNDNPAHTAVRNYRSDDQELLSLLAEEAWSDLIGANIYLA